MDMLVPLKETHHPPNHPHEETHRPPPLVVVAAVAAVTALALLVRWAGIDQEPLHDELYNYLAATAWLERGELSIVPGADPYSRGRFFTTLIAWVMESFGPSLASARLVAVFTGTAVAGLFTWWLARNGLVVASLVAGGLIALDPELMELSQISRFYTLQHLGFLSAALAFAALVRSRHPGRAAGLALVTILGLTLALHVQITTIIGVGGLALFALLWPESHLHRLGRRALDRYPLGLPLGVVGAGVGLFAVAWLTGILSAVIDLATYADVWAEGARYNVRYYYAWLHDHYAALVVLFPLLLLFSWIRAPRITALSLAVFGVAFLVHSGLAWKTNRYLSYALPFFFGISGIGAVEGVRWLRQELPGLVEQLAVPIGFRQAAALTVLGVTLLSLFIGNRGLVVSARSITRDPITHFPLMGPEDGELSWTLATPVIDSLAADAGALVSSNPLKAVHFLDRLDYILSLSSLRGAEGERQDFWVDPRFDRPVVIQATALERIRCEHDTLVLVEDVTFRNRLVFPGPTANYLQLEARRLPMPPRSGIHAFWLERDPDDAMCSEPLPEG